MLNTVTANPNKIVGLEVNVNDLKRTNIAKNAQIIQIISTLMFTLTFKLLLVIHVLTVISINKLLL